MAWYGIGFGDAFKRAFQKYATFSGRASRGEFWWFQLASTLICLIPFVNIIYICVAFVPSLALTCRRLHDMGESWSTFWVFVILSDMLAIVGLTLPLFVVSYGSGLSNVTSLSVGLFIFFEILALACGIYLCILYAHPSEATANQYGPGPDEVAQYVANAAQNNPLATPIAQQTTPAEPPQPPAPPSESDPILAELANPDTPPTRLHEIAALAINHPEYRPALLFHPNTYPELTEWIHGLT